MKFISAKTAAAEYPSGCSMCGHEVQYLSRKIVEPGPERDFYDHQRGTETLKRAIPLCASCAKGPMPHRRSCRGCA